MLSIEDMLLQSGGYFGCCQAFPLQNTNICVWQNRIARLHLHLPVKVNMAEQMLNVKMQTSNILSQIAILIYRPLLSDARVGHAVGLLLACCIHFYVSKGPLLQGTKYLQLAALVRAVVWKFASGCMYLAAPAERELCEIWQYSSSAVWHVRNDVLLLQAL